MGGGGKAKTLIEATHLEAEILRGERIQGEVTEPGDNMFPSSQVSPSAPTHPRIKGNHQAGWTSLPIKGGIASHQRLFSDAAQYTEPPGQFTTTHLHISGVFSVNSNTQTDWRLAAGIRRWFLISALQVRLGWAPRCAQQNVARVTQGLACAPRRPVSCDSAFLCAPSPHVRSQLKKPHGECPP